MIPDRLQYFLKHFWNDQNVTKCGPSDPAFITKILQTLPEIMGTSLNNIIFISENLKFWETWKVHVPHFLKLVNLILRKTKLWATQHLEISKLKFCNWTSYSWNSGFWKWAWQFGTFGNWKQNIWKHSIWQFENRTFGNWKFEILKIGSVDISGIEMLCISVFIKFCEDGDRTWWRSP